MIATDQTGQFPIVSIIGMQYIMVFYNYDSNVILAQPCQSRTGPELAETYNKVYKRFRKAGVIQVIQQLDNKVSDRLIEAIEEKNLNYQLASPHVHCLNSTERAIQAFKNHFISNLHGCDRDFSAYTWSEIIPQCEMTLNIIGRSRINPKLSAYTQMFGMFNYNKTPLTLLGTKSLTHKRLKQQRKFAGHRKIRYIIGPAMHKYQYLEFHIPETRGKKRFRYIRIPPNKIRNANK